MKAFLLKIGVEGIQKYITSTGKLKEMIGGSEIINSIASPDFYKPIIEDELKLAESAQMLPGEDKYIVAQANAGTLCLIVFAQAKAKAFLQKASEQLLSAYPGLPFYTALADFDWADTKEGRQAYSDARKRNDEQINAQRSAGPVPCGSPLLPILKPARLDSLPTTVNKDNDRISLPSLARSQQRLLDQSREHLQEDIGMNRINLVWENDLDKMLQGEQSKVALICMDGNDLGKLFGARLEDAEDKTLTESIKSFKELSEKIQECNKKAFKYACDMLIDYKQQVWSAKHPDKPMDKLTMPLRPLVMGGDDITIIAAADIALPFIDVFTRKFEEESGDFRLSLGIGMVVMPSGYPFARAFPLAEELQDAAKKLTKDKKPGERPSSIDYLVLTEDVENDLTQVRERLYTTPAAHKLTGKPFMLQKGNLAAFIKTASAVLNELPRSQIREAWTVCRADSKAVKPLWHNLRENISRGLGGRKQKLMGMEKFTAIFPDNFFIDSAGDQKITLLGDYLEMERLLPQSESERQLVTKTFFEVN